MASSQMFTPTKGRVAGGGKATNRCDSNRIGHTAPFQAVNSLKDSMATVSFESDGSTSAGSFASSGQSMSQVGRSDTTPMTPLRTRRNSHVNHTSENWRSPRDTSLNGSCGTLGMPSPVTYQRAFVNGIPEHLAVQEMAFRQGQHDYNGSHDKIPPNPFAKPFDNIWAQYYSLGAAYGKPPATTSIAASPPSHGNFAWSVLINPATQDLEHPNGSVDMEWARTICIMGLKCMRELISIVCRRHNDWRKIVCDIPLPVKHAIVAFPDLCEHYEALLRDAHEALSGRLPIGY